MEHRRTIGRWALTGLMVNSIVGSGIFGLPGTLLRILGDASPWAFVLAGLVIAVVVACFAEVGSRFARAGGPYLYVRTAFGRFAGIQVAWFATLGPVAAGAAQANLFTAYLAEFNASFDLPLLRALVITGVIGLPVIANIRGVNAGKTLSSILVIAKLIPLALLIGLGLLHTDGAAHALAAQGVVHPSLSLLMGGVLLAVFSYGGFEDILAATGDVREPQRSVAFSLAMSLTICVLVYSLLQVVTVSVLSGGGEPALQRPLSAVAGVLMGRGGATMVALAAMISTAGAISATVLAIPRILASLGEHGDAPKAFVHLEGADRTPIVATVTVGAAMAALAITATFPVALAVTAGSLMIISVGVCAALIRLRATRETITGVRLPFGRTLAVIGILISLLLLLQLHQQEARLMLAAVAMATANWLFVVMRRAPEKGRNGSQYLNSSDTAT